jgi:hypothetical protein
MGDNCTAWAKKMGVQLSRAPTIRQDLLGAETALFIALQYNIHCLLSLLAFTILEALEGPIRGGNQLETSNCT